MKKIITIVIVCSMVQVCWAPREEYSEGGRSRGGNAGRRDRTSQEIAEEMRRMTEEELNKVNLAAKTHDENPKNNRYEKRKFPKKENASSQPTLSTKSSPQDEQAAAFEEKLTKKTENDFSLNLSISQNVSRDARDPEIVKKIKEKYRNPKKVADDLGKQLNLREYKVKAVEKKAKELEEATQNLSENANDLINKLTRESKELNSIKGIIKAFVRDLRLLIKGEEKEISIGIETLPMGKEDVRQAVVKAVNEKKGKK